MPGRRAARGAKRCPECGVDLRPGVKYCDFCGEKVADDVAAPPAGGGKAPSPRRSIGGVLAVVAVACVAAGILAFGVRRQAERQNAPTPPAAAPDARRQAAATCETAIRGQVRAPFRVIAFRSALVAEERGAYAVSGTVEVQSVAGEVRRQRYSCRIRQDPQSGMVAEGVMLQ